MAEWREEQLKQQLLQYHFPIENICVLDKYDDVLSEKVFCILLEWACYGQNAAGILMGREKIAEVPRSWLKAHLVKIVKSSFDYSDYWNFGRLLELVEEILPECKNELLFLNSGTTDPDLIDIMELFQ